MRLVIMTLASAALFMATDGLISDAYAHGGAYRGPAGEVPPDSREPSDPPPPPEGGGGPTTGGGDVGGPTTGGGGGGPTTGGGGGPATGGGGGAPPPTGGGAGGPITGGVGGGGAAAAPGFEDWTFWWNFNKDEILQLKSEVKRTQTGVQSGTTVHVFGRRKSESNVKSATEAAINEKIKPALKAMLEMKDLNFDIQSASAIALAKMGDETVIPTLKKMALNEKKDYHRVVEESAALAFGLLQHDSEEVRNFLIELVGDKDRNASYVRPFAAISLGLLGSHNAETASATTDDRVSETLIDVLAQKETKPDIKPACLMALGMIGNESMVPDLLAMLENGKVNRKGAVELKGIEKSFVIQALGKIGAPGTAEDKYAVINKIESYVVGKKAKKNDVNLRRSSSIAMGQLAPQCDGGKQIKIIKNLKAIAKDGKDASERNLALIAIGRIAATEGIDDKTRGEAVGALRYYLKEGKPASLMQPFAALGMGLIGRSMANPPEETIKKPLREKFEAGGAPRPRGAYAIASGLVRDKLAVPTLTEVLEESNDSKLKGYSAVALGMIGDQNAKEAVRTALTTDNDRNVRVRTAIAAGLMGDATVIDELVKILESGEESQYVLGSVALALGQIGDERAIDPLLRISADADKKFPEITRALATVALGQISDRRDVPVLARVARDINFRAIGQIPSLNELLTIL